MGLFSDGSKGDSPALRELVEEARGKDARAWHLAEGFERRRQRLVGGG